MLKLLGSEKYQLFWFIFHAGLGFACVQSKWPLIFWFYIVCLGFVVSFFSKKDLQFNVLCFLAYVLGIEVLGRGAGCTPFIPQEVGKYSAFLFFFIGLALGGPIKKVSLYGIGMLLLSLPGILIMPEYRMKDIVFNYLGLVALFLGVIFCSRQIVTYKQFKMLLRIMVYAIFSLACFTIFKAATFEKIEYKLTANYESSGGSITNQVSTLFGTGICVIVIMFLSGQRLFKYRWMDISLLLLFCVRGLLTFSRGGMVSAALAILLIVLIPKAKAAFQDAEVRLKKVSPGSFLVLVLGLTLCFYFVNAFTNNYLVYRYEGKTERSLQTGFDNSVGIDQITSGRISIMNTDFNMFLANPALGVGVGQSKWLRPLYGGKSISSTHLEFSRLLAEHGFLGFILVIMLYFYPGVKVLREPNNYRRIVMVVFFVMSLSCTFHNAMRTMITPLLFSFAFLYIVPDGYDWRAHLKTKRRFTPPGGDLPSPAS